MLGKKKKKRIGRSTVEEKRGKVPLLFYSPSNFAEIEGEKENKQKRSRRKKGGNVECATFSMKGKKGVSKVCRQRSGDLFSKKKLKKTCKRRKKRRVRSTPISMEE